ncbi:MULTISPECIES: PKD domain-containing protein [Pirellulaceae]|nr:MULTISPECIES: PKD domain-containing protein [Pirellulaceae]
MTTHGDDFGGTDGVQLNGREASIGGTLQGWPWVSDNPTYLTIQSNQLRHTYNSGTTTFTPGFTLGSDDYEISWRHVTRGDRNGNQTYYLRWDNATSSGYRVYFHPFAQIQIYRVDEGVSTLLGSITSLAWADNHVRKVRIVGGVIQAFIDGVQKLQVADSTYTDGIVKFAVNDGGNSTFLTLDDFTLEELAVTMPPTARFRTTRDNLQVTVNDFSEDVDGEIVGRSVSWGDGSPDDSGAGTEFTHTYDAPGTYTVTVTVTDNDDESTSEAQILTVVADQDAIASVVPGATAPADWTATAQPSAVGSGDFVDAKPMAALDIDLDLLYGALSEDRTVYIAAKHARGIDRVELFANNGTAAVAIKPIKVPSTKQVKGRTAYPFRLTAANFPSGYFQLRAVVYPKVGVPRVLQDSTKTYYHDGAFPFNGGSAVVKYLDNTVDTSGDGSSGTPFKSITDVITAKKASSSTRAEVWDLRIRNASIRWLGDWTDVTTGLWTGACQLSADTNYVPHCVIEFDGTLNNDASGYIRQRDAIFTFMPTVSFDLGPDASTTTATNLQGALPQLYGGLHIFRGSEIFATTGIGSVAVAKIPVLSTDTEIETYDASHLPESGSYPIFDATNERETISWTGKSGNTLTGVTGLTQDHTDQITIGRVLLDRRVVASTNWVALCDGVAYHDLPWKFPQTQYLRSCEVYEIGADYVFRLGACLDTYSHDIWPDGHGDITQVYSSTNPASAPFDNSYLDGVVGELFTYETSHQAGLYADHPGYKNILLSRLLLKSNPDRAVQLAFGSDHAEKSFEHLLVDRVTVPGCSIRLSNGQGCAFKNVMLTRNISRWVSFETNPNYDACEARAFAYVTDLTGTTAQYVTDGVQLARTDTFVNLSPSTYDPESASFKKMDLTPKGAAATIGGAFPSEWPEYDVFGNPFTDEAGAVAVTSNSFPLAFMNHYLQLIGAR